jgi:alanyl aminopeptidase
MKIKLLVLLFVAAMSTLGCSGGNDNTIETVDLSLPEHPPTARLPEGIVPTHYTLHLEIDPRLDRFRGSATIDIELAAATSFLWLHGLDLNITSARAISGGDSIELGWTQASPHGVAKLTAQSTLPAGQARLQFEYNAPFNTSLDGLYKVTKGEDAYAFTQFEATSARLAFPAFDEPAHKVPFDISLTVPEAFTAITNSPQINESAGTDGSKTLTFATTAPLPTYLVAFAVGPFDVVEWEPITANTLRPEPVPLRGITTRGKGDEIHFALENTADILTALEAYFDTPYPYAKLDIIAVPDFAAGAMENAGAITYREQLILLDDEAPVRQKRNFFVTHAHELAHQWFGNLVTPLWWDDIWLNEAFATWNSHVILDQLFPDEKYREALQNSASSVMRSDSLASARQIREPIERHEDIGSAFNGITYKKGGGVLSMFESFLGRENFREGIRHYMKVFAFGNTTAEDFIEAIAQANPQVDGDDLRAAFGSYIQQAGLPLVSAELTCDETGAHVLLHQERYLPTGSDGSTDQRWTIPVCVSALQDGLSSSKCFILRTETDSFDLDTERCPDAILPNTGGSSYYRWSLPPEQWMPLLQRFEQLSSNEQISVANGLSAAVNKGSMGLSDYLSAVPVIAGSRSWRVAMAPRGDLDKIREFVANAGERQILEAKIRQWYRPHFERLGALTDRSENEDQFLAKTMSILAREGNDSAIRARLVDAGAAYAGYNSDQKIHPEAADPNVRQLALVVAAEEIGKPYTDLLWRHFKKSDNAQLRQQLLLAMASNTDPAVAAIMRDRILSPDLKDNEIFYIYYGQMAHADNRQASWEWTQSNLWAVLERIPNWAKGRLPSNFGNFCSREQANDLENFFSPIIDSLVSGPRYLANTLESIRLCAAFVDLHSTTLENSAETP